MRIGYTHHAFCRQSYTGIARYLTKLISNLEYQGIDHLKVLAPIYTDKFLSSLKEHHVSGWPAPTNSPLIRLFTRHLNACIAPYQIAKWKPDIIHETYYSARSLAPPQCKTVLTVHDMIHEQFPENFYSWDKTQQFKKNAIERADHIICISENTRKDLLSFHNIPLAKISVVHLGVDRIPHIPQTLGSALPNELNRPYLLYVGQRNGYKNFQKFIEAYAASKKLINEFDIVCFGGNAFTQNEIKLITSLHVNHNVHQISGNDNVLSLLFAHASLFVYPSLYEGFGLPVLEAMAHSCPVACSNTSSMPEVAGNAAAYFTPHDAESIRQTLEDVLFSELSRQALTKAGHSRLELFTWEQCAKQTAAIYQSLVQ